MIQVFENLIGGVMVTVLACLVKRKTIEMIVLFLQLNFLIVKEI